MGNFVITIARQYGSGGHTIGTMLAERLNIPFYDKEIIRMASDESGIDLGLFGKVEGGESLKNSWFGSSKTKTGLYKGELIPPHSKDFISDENIFNYQAKVAKDIANQTSAVIVGRCVNHIFKDRPDTLRVFIHSPWDLRIERSMEKVAGSREEIGKFLQKDDKRKMEYYRRFAGGDWKDPTEYDLCLNTGKLNYEECVEMIITQMKMMQSR